MLWDLFKRLVPCWPGFGGPVSTRNLDDLPLSVCVICCVFVPVYTPGCAFLLCTASACRG